MENMKAQTDKNPKEGLTRRREQKPASAAEASGDYGDTVIEAERDASQKNYQPKPTTAEPGVDIRRGRVEHYNDKTASENQGR